MNSVPILLSIISASLYGGFQGGGVLSLILDAGPVVKLVLLALLLFSVGSWAIIFSKFKTIRKADLESKEFLRIFWSKRDFASIYADARKFRYSPIAEIFRAGYGELNQLRKKENPNSGDKNLKDIIQSEGLDNVIRSLKRSNTNQAIRLERYLSFLATTGNSAPFIGLFGTVWGIMEAFHKIGQKGATSLAVVAPGISEALIATAVGLFAAIPAVIAYNYFLSRIKRLSSEMDNFAAEFLNIIERYYK